MKKVYILYDERDTHPVMLGVFSSYKLAEAYRKWAVKHCELSCSSTSRVLLDCVSLRDLPVSALGVDSECGESTDET